MALPLTGATKPNYYRPPHAGYSPVALPLTGATNPNYYRPPQPVHSPVALPLTGATNPNYYWTLHPGYSPVALPLTGATKPNYYWTLHPGYSPVALRLPGLRGVARIRRLRRHPGRPHHRCPRFCASLSSFIISNSVIATSTIVSAAPSAIFPRSVRLKIATGSVVQPGG